MLLPRYILGFQGYIFAWLYFYVDQAVQCYYVKVYWNFEVIVLRFCVDRAAGSVPYVFTWDH
jgi:hypothetical protein